AKLADTGRKAELLRVPLPCPGPLAQLALQPFQHAQCRLRPTRAKQHAELFAAGTRGQIRGATGVLQESREVLQGGIARRMAQTIVQGLEVVDVENGEAERTTALASLADRLLRGLDQAASIGEAGQEVRRCSGLPAHPHAL